jgi:hypothetical protein
LILRAVSKTIEELRLEWKAENSVIMAKELRMPQFEIVRISASNCQESFQIGMRAREKRMKGYL